MSHSCKKGEYIYLVKWKGWESKHNTEEPEVHLLTCSVLLGYWKGKIKGKKPTQPQAAQVARVTKLQLAALRERQEAVSRRGPSWSSGPYNPYRHLIPHMITRVERKQSSAGPRPPVAVRGAAFGQRRVRDVSAVQTS